MCTQAANGKLEAELEGTGSELLGEDAWQGYAASLNANLFEDSVEGNGPPRQDGGGDDAGSGGFTSRLWRRFTAGR